MTVRGWLMIGPARHSADGLPPGMYVGVWESLPNAANFKVGQWLEWKTGPGHGNVCVCIEVAL